MEKKGSKPRSCNIRIRVIMNRVIMRLTCISFIPKFSTFEIFSKGFIIMSMVIHAVITLLFEQIETDYHKDPKFSDARKLCCKLPKIQTKRPNHRILCPKDANGIANSEDPDQTAPLGAV